MTTGDSVHVVVGTFGDYKQWRPLAERALRSVEAQSFKDYLDWTHVHADSLSEARNSGAKMFQDADWLIFLDADDELDKFYVEEMLQGSGDVRWPSTLGVVDGREDDYPVLIKQHASLLVGNHIVIGAMVRRSLFEEVGGFREFPILEDWDLWLRCALAGADMQPCEKAIYRVHVRSNSRNKQGDFLHGHYYEQIRNEHQAAWYARFGR